MSDDFDIWQKQWDAASAAWEKEEKQKPVQTSFFNNLPSDEDYEPTDPGEEDIEDWIDIYNGSLDDGNLLTEEGFGDLVRGKKQITKGSIPYKPNLGDITYQTNPIHFASVGRDANDGPTRVSRFSTSEELLKIHDMKIRMERLERKIHETQVNGKSAASLKKEWTKMKKEIADLSEKAQSQPDKDVT